MLYKYLKKRRKIRRANTHDGRLNTNSRESTESSENLQLELLSSGSLHQQHDGSTITQLR